MTDLSAWIGREETRVETLDRVRSDALVTALGDAPRAGDALPWPHHWLHFWDVKPPSQIGDDGHPAKGGFLPPVPMPRRMWAGGRLSFFGPVRFGETVERRSNIRTVAKKAGRTGELVFVTVRHTLAVGSETVLEEEQDLVYRAAATEPLVLPPPEDDLPAADWRRGVATDPLLLFRFSALTMNGHRIHYDEPYASEVERYPGLVVHGPLQATLMLGDALAASHKQPRSFSFRGLSPAISGTEISVCGRETDGGAEVWVEQAGRRTMTGQVEWEAEA